LKCCLPLYILRTPLSVKNIFIQAWLAGWSILDLLGSGHKPLNQVGTIMIKRVAAKIRSAQKAKIRASKFLAIFIE
jgi:hypothetical protein